MLKYIVLAIYAMKEIVQLHNKQNTTFNFIHDLRGGFRLNDITLACPEGEIKANQSILISNCKAIKNILGQHFSFEHPYIYFADQSMRNINLLLQYLYNGRANLAPNEKQSFLNLAEDLQIQGVLFNEDAKEESTQVLEPGQINDDLLDEQEKQSDGTSVSDQESINEETSKYSYIRTHYIQSLVKDQFSRNDKRSSSTSTYVKKCNHCERHFVNKMDKMLEHLTRKHTDVMKGLENDIDKRLEKNSQGSGSVSHKFSEDVLERSNMKITKRRPRKSVVFDEYIRKDGSLYGDCKHCGKSIQMISFGLKEHLKRRHNEVWRNVERIDKEPETFLH